MKLRSPEHWSDYQLIDSGQGMKLERFGDVTLIRPEPQAIWDMSLAMKEWQGQADAQFIRDSSKSRMRTGEYDGWKYAKKLPPNWRLRYRSDKLDFQLKLAFTAFGHVGVFPEQADNWEYISDVAQHIGTGSVLNLFAYTGGASLAARAAGFEVTHVDAVRNMINWANENQQQSKLDGIKWVVEDALKFTQKEVKRGKQYQGIILDPPAYGRGPAGEKWVLEEGLPEILKACGQLLAPTKSFLILNLYSMGLSAVVAANLAKAYFNAKEVEFGEFVIKAVHGHSLPLGIFVRFTRP